ncbi:TPA: hydrolase [Streptococcus suis]|uniref:hydrolase n=1 Tax=Streptococcus parasuis TaxID=1501662 RepID=UPI001D9F3757|nr:hydrolase [Streptococcus parasuis]MCA9760006.1 hydrolase [Streptococcus sp.]MDG4498451.1 hydrolase [Streptococcus suis]NCB78390.1 hydrolase [Bacilli bacterium]WDN59433.1 hydrolase [Streptococcus parasuis]WDN61286.1 hydrolase [Streptococcus parasuis]
MTQPHIPSVMSDLRQDIVQMPEVIKECSGIRIYGRRIRSILFTTDVSIIANHNADAILAVYPFTPVPAIIKSIMMVASVPVLAGVGGGLTTGVRSANMSLLSESEGAYAVVVNGPTTVETIEEINKVIDIPIIYTVVSDKSDIKSRIEAGVDILNVSCGVETPKVVEKIRKEYPDFPIMATGGPTEESIRQVIAAGANAITYTAPSNGELFKGKMEKYRKHAAD